MKQHRHESIDTLLSKVLSEQDEPGKPSKYSKDWERFTEELSKYTDSLRETSRKPGFELSNVDIVLDHLQQALNLMVDNY